MDGSDALLTALKANSGVTTLLTTDSQSNKEIIIDIVEPEDWGVADTCISIYSANPVDKGLPYLDSKWVANCRASTAKAAMDLSTAVIDAINREPIGSNGGRYYCVRFFLIRPANSADAYNMPVEISIKGSRNLD